VSRQAGLTVTFPVLGYSFPSWRILFGHLDPDAKVSAVRAFSAAYLARFAKAGDQYVRVVSPESPLKPVVVFAGASFVGLIMPARTDEGVSLPDWARVPKPKAVPA
jgi:hypothetical protein